MTYVKICGITNTADARLSLRYADAVGLIIDVPVQTPRKITLDEAVKIARACGGRIVAVIMPESIDEVRNVCEQLNPFALQFHGDETPQFMEKVKALGLPQKIIKVIHIDVPDADAIIKRIKKYEPFVDAILLDTRTDKVGGTGKTHDWQISRVVVGRSNKPVILSGGLTPENVVDAVRIVRPFAVDTASGVELAPGRKDPDKVKRFAENAKLGN